MSERNFAEVDPLRRVLDTIEEHLKLSGLSENETAWDQVNRGIAAAFCIQNTIGSTQHGISSSVEQLYQIASGLCDLEMPENPETSKVPWSTWISLMSEAALRQVELEGSYKDSEPM